MHMHMSHVTCTCTCACAARPVSHTCYVRNEVQSGKWGFPRRQTWPNADGTCHLEQVRKEVQSAKWNFLVAALVAPDKPSVVHREQACSNPQLTF